VEQSGAEWSRVERSGVEWNESESESESGMKIVENATGELIENLWVMEWMSE